MSLESAVTVKDLAAPEQRREFIDGTHRDVVALSSVLIGRGEYRPGWRWSVHVGPVLGRPSERHVAYIISGRMMVRGRDGVEVEVGAGCAFEASPDHDAWVLGDEPCVALDVAPL